MKCLVCGRTKPINPWITGIIFDLDGITTLAVAYRCKCGNNRDIRWPVSTEPERAQARQAQLSLDATSEMMMGGQ